MDFTHNTALGLNQPLTEMSIRNLPWGKARPELKADTLFAICEIFCEILNVTENHGLPLPVTGKAFYFF
jgi:hypothetical protein